MRSLLRTTVRAALGALSAAPLLAPNDAGAQAAAQGACGAATLADYVAFGFSCTIGPWRLADFLYTARSFDPSEVAPTASQITVDPFASLDSLGRRTFGFSFGGFFASAVASGAPAGLTGIIATSHLNFTVEAVGPGPRLAGAMFDVGAGIAGDPVAAQFLSASASGFVTALRGVGECGGAGADHSYAVGSTIVHAETACHPGPTDAVFVGLGASGVFFRDDPAAGDFFVHGGGRVDRVTFVVAPTVTTPEPATLALVGGGLLGLALGWVRRRRA